MRPHGQRRLVRVGGLPQGAVELGQPLGGTRRQQRDLLAEVVVVADLVAAQGRDSRSIASTSTGPLLPSNSSQRPCSMRRFCRCQPSPPWCYSRAAHHHCSTTSLSAVTSPASATCRPAARSACS